MKNLKLHSTGKEDYANALIEEFEQLILKIKNSLLTKAEKEIELKKAKEERFKWKFLLKPQSK